MKYFLKLCGVSLIYGLFYNIFIYLLTSPYELESLTGWSQTTITKILINYTAVVFILSFILIPLFTNKWLRGSMHSLWTSVLWVPFAFILAAIISILFPQLYYELDLLSQTLEAENVVTNWISGFSILIYPLFIIVVTSLSMLIPLKKMG